MVALFRRRQPMTLRTREAVQFYLFISLWFIGFILFTGGPVVYSFIMSLTDWNGYVPGHFVGLSNYIDLFAHDPLFWITIKNTAVYASLSVSIGTSLALGLAILMNQRLPGIRLFRTLFYLPSVTTGVAIAIGWLWLFNPQFGLINFLLGLVGVQGPKWMGSQQWALPALVIMSMWTVGGNMIILLAGLQGVPLYLYEAARIDGANRWQEFVSITLPMLSPYLFFVIVISIINSFQIFDNVYIMTAGTGGPGTATLVYVMQLYNNAYVYNKMGYASAMAWILCLLIMILTLIMFRFSRSWVFYESELV